MDSQEAQRFTTDTSEQNSAMVKQTASHPPAFQVRPQGPPSASPRFPTNNGSGGPRLAGPQPPALRRLDSRSSLVTGQRPFGPSSPQGPPIRPQGFPQRAPQPQLFPGQNQGFPNSPGGGPPKRFPSGPPQGPRLQNQPGPRSLATAGQPPHPQANHPPLGPNSLQYNSNRPQGFPQRTPSQSSIHLESPDGSRPGTPSSGGRLSTIFPQRQLMSGPEGLPPQTNAEVQRDPRNDIPVSVSDSIALQRNPLDPKTLQNVPSMRPEGIHEDKLNTDGKLGNDTLGGEKKTLENAKADIRMENLNGKQKLSINNDDDDDVVVDSDSNKTAHLPARPTNDRPLSSANEKERQDSASSQKTVSSSNLNNGEQVLSKSPSLAEEKERQDSASSQKTSASPNLNNGEQILSKTTSSAEKKERQDSASSQKTVSLPNLNNEEQILSQKPSSAKEKERQDSASSQKTSASSNLNNEEQILSRTPEVTASPTPSESHSEHEPEPAKNLERKSSAESNLRGEIGSNLNDEQNHEYNGKTPTPEPAKSPAPRAVEIEALKTATESPSREKNSESPVTESQTNLSSPLPPKSLETTPGISPKPCEEKSAVQSPLLNQELEERLSVSMSPEASPKSLSSSVIRVDEGNVRSVSPKSPVPSSSPSPNPPKSPISVSQSPNAQNAADLSGTHSPVSIKSPTPLPTSPNPSQKSPTSTPQSPNPPKSPGCLRSMEGEKSGRSTPDAEGAKKRATFAKDLIMSGANEDEENPPSDSKDIELTTPEESSKGTPTTPSKETPTTPKKSFSPSSDRSRHRSRSPKSDKGKSPEKESPAARNRTARESKDRSKASANRSRKTEGDNDSGVDESTQGNELTANGDAGSPTKAHSKIPGPKRSISSSPTKSPSKSAKGLSKTPDAATSASAEKKKLPMNKVQVGAAPSPNLKTVRSKIGSLENTSYKPGGGKIKIENRKLDFSKAQPKIAAKNDKYTPSGGDKKITQVKLQWNAKPKVGSLENSTYKPGGGDKKIETVKLDFKEKAKPKVASKDNVKHVPGGGTVKSSTTPPKTPEKVSDNIETLKIEVKAESKVGSMDNVKHKPGGGDKKIFNDKDYLRQTSSNVESLSGSGSQENQGNVVLNVISPSPARKMKKLAEAEDSTSPSSPSANPSSPIRNPATTTTTPTRSKSRSEKMPVPPTTTPVDEKKAFPQSRKSSLVKTPDRSKTPEPPKKVTIAETDEVRPIENKRSPKSPKSPTEKKPKTPEDRRPSTPRRGSAALKSPDTDESKPSTPRIKSPLKKSPSTEERKKSPTKKSIPNQSPTSSAGRVTPRKGRSSPPNSLPLNNPEGTNEKMRKSSSKEFRLPQIVSNILPELSSSRDTVISTTPSESRIALPKLVDTPTQPSRTGVAQ